MNVVKKNELDGPNTKIEFLYRDASNYKIWNEVIVKGRFTEDMIDTVMDSLVSVDEFIPGAVGLEGERFSDVTEDDTPYFELYRSGFSATNQKPTSDLTAEQLTENFAKCKGEWEKYEDIY